MANSANSDQTVMKKQSDPSLSCLLFRQAVVTSNPNQHLTCQQERKVFKILEHLP